MGDLGGEEGGCGSAKSTLDRVRRKPKTIEKQAISETLRVCYDGVGGVDIHARTQKLSIFPERRFSPFPQYTTEITTSRSHRT
jgi:hypothetical protein